MSETEIQRQMQEARQNPPAWKRELLRKIDSLARQPGALRFFRRHIRAVAKAQAAQPNGANGSDPKELLRPGPPLALPEKVFILGAFHDVFIESERLSPIMKWGSDKAKECWKHPDFRLFAVYYGHYGGLCAYFDKRSEPAILERFLEDVRACLMRRKLFCSLLTWAILFAAMEGCVLVGAWLWGTGDNLWQKILASLPYLSIVLGVCLGGFLLHSGKAGRRLFKQWKGQD